MKWMVSCLLLCCGGVFAATNDAALTAAHLLGPGRAYSTRDGYTFYRDDGVAFRIYRTREGAVVSGSDGSHHRLYATRDGYSISSQTRARGEAGEYVLRSGSARVDLGENGSRYWDAAGRSGTLYPTRDGARVYGPGLASYNIQQTRDGFFSYTTGPGDSAGLLPGGTNSTGTVRDR